MYVTVGTITSSPGSRDGDQRQVQRRGAVVDRHACLTLQKRGEGLFESQDDLRPTKSVRIRQSITYLRSLSEAWLGELDSFHFHIAHDAGTRAIREGSCILGPRAFAARKQIARRRPRINIAVALGSQRAAPEPHQSPRR